MRMREPDVSVVIDTSVSRDDWVPGAATVSRICSEPGRIERAACVLPCVVILYEDNIREG